MGQGRQRIGQRPPVRNLGADDEGQQEQQEQRGHHAEEYPEADLGGPAPVAGRRLVPFAVAPAAGVCAPGVFPELRAHGRFSAVAALPLAWRMRSSSSSDTVCGT
ncbi:hypothetical protein D3C77_680630 [compost metagenome]